MNKRKYKTNPEELLAMGRIIAKQGGNDAKFQHRVETVNLVLSGHSAAELSKNMGCHANTIIRWVKIVDEQGVDALHDRKGGGRPPRISVKQKKKLTLPCKKTHQNTATMYGMDPPYLISCFAPMEYNTQSGLANILPVSWGSVMFDRRCSRPRDMRIQRSAMSSKKTDGASIRPQFRHRIAG